MDKQKRKDILGAMHLVSNDSKQNYVSAEKLMDIARAHEVPIVEASGILSFYSQFSDKPRGKYIIRLCDSLSCRISGSVDVYLYLQDKLGIKNNETTKDGLFTLEIGQCVGACDSAPNILVNHTLHRKMTPSKIDEIINVIKNEEE